MKTSESTAQLATALAAAQSEFKNPECNKTVKVTTRDGRSYSYNYAPLNSVFDVTRAALAKNGLSHLSATRLEGNQTILCYRLMHKSGEWVEAELPLINTPDPKALAADNTYKKRYLFNGLVGIAGDDDQDGEPEAGQTNGNRGADSDGKAASPGQGPKPVTPPATGPTPKPGPGASGDDVISEAQLVRLRTIASKVGVTEEIGAAILSAHGYKDAAHIKRKDYNEIVAHIQQAGTIK